MWDNDNREYINSANMLNLNGTCKNPSASPNIGLNHNSTIRVSEKQNGRANNIDEIRTLIKAYGVDIREAKRQLNITDHHYSNTKRMKTWRYDEDEEFNWQNLSKSAPAPNLLHPSRQLLQPPNQHIQAPPPPPPQDIIVVPSLNINNRNNSIDPNQHIQASMYYPPSPSPPQLIRVVPSLNNRNNSIDPNPHIQASMYYPPSPSPPPQDIVVAPSLNNRNNSIDPNQHFQASMYYPPPAPAPLNKNSNNNFDPSSTQSASISDLLCSLVAKGVISLEKQALPPAGVRQETVTNTADLPRECKTCGRRFKCQEEHRKHMDWHFINNERQKRANLKKKLQNNNDNRPDEDDDTTAVTADYSQKACTLCEENFEDFYSDETEEWMYKGAIYMNNGCEFGETGPIVHAKCMFNDATNVIN